MRPRSGLFILSLFLAAAQAAMAQQRPGHLETWQVPGHVQDQGLGSTGQAPGESAQTGQVPGQSQRDPVSPDSVRVVNHGNSTLAFAYWDGGAWKQVSLGSGSAEAVACPKCDGTIVVSFHDGVQAQELTVRTGSAYRIHWAGQRWAFELQP